MRKYDYDDSLTPDDIRAMDDKQLSNLINLLLVKSTDFSIVQDLIRDRNDFKRDYFMLVDQLTNLGIKPVINYYQQNKKRKSNKKGNK